MRSHSNHSPWRLGPTALCLALAAAIPPSRAAADADASPPRILDTVERAQQLERAGQTDPAPRKNNAESSTTLLADDVAESHASELDAAVAGGRESVVTWLEQLTAGQGQRGAGLQLLLLMSVMSVAPALLLMTTSFIRISVVLAMLRQALGGQQTPSNQIVAGLAVLLTFLIMTPVWRQVHETAVEPYLAEGSTMSLHEAWEAGVIPVRQFMSRQIDAAGNSEDVWLFYRHLPEASRNPTPQTYDAIPLQALLPAYVVSELKIAFLIGFQIYLPFLVLDIVVASATASMGMMMMQPATIAMPFKLLLFVMMDGWRLVVGMLLQSFAV